MNTSHHPETAGHPQPHDASPAATTGNLATCMILGDRSRGDGCPGAIRMHEATDGFIGRVRFPGGAIPADAWTHLAETAETFGDGDIHLTTRGNVQIRGVRDPEALSEHLASSGLIPSPAHDKMRNIITEPLLPEWGELARELDAALLAEPRTATLSGRTLFALDEGAGRVLRFQPDLGLARHSHLAGQPINPTSDTVDLIIAGTTYRPTSPLTLHDALPVVVELAAAWADIRDTAWRVAERADAAEQLLQASGITAHEQAPESEHATAHLRPIGWFDIDDEGHPIPAEDATSHLDDHTAHDDSQARRVSLGVAVPFARVRGSQARLLGAIGRPTTVTAWPSITIHHLDESEAEAVVKVLAPEGFVFHRDSPQVRITACTGLPGCDKSATDVRRDARELMASPDTLNAYLEDVMAEAGHAPADDTTLVHFVGCSRRCGHPRAEHVEFLATGEGEYVTTLQS